MESWRKMVTEAMKEHSDGWGSVVHSTLSDAELDIKFDSGYGTHEGRAFTLWTLGRVYFPVVYDGAEWVGSAPRDPCDEACSHFGGE